MAFLKGESYGKPVKRCEVYIKPQWDTDWSFLRIFLAIEVFQNRLQRGKGRAVSQVHNHSGLGQRSGRRQDEKWLGAGYIWRLQTAGSFGLMGYEI